MLKKYRSLFCCLICFGNVVAFSSDYLFGQQVIRKPQRAAPPDLAKEDFQGVFFDRATEHLVGDPPQMAGQNSKDKIGVGSASEGKMSGNAGPDAGPGEGAGTGAGSIWKERISTQSIEDLVKETKLRLDGIVTTPAKFSSGAFKDARRDFTLLATLFTVIELYPEKVRWQASAAVARSRFARVASNTKVGSAPAYNEAKLRLEDMNSLLKGATLTDPASATEIAWSEIADRNPSMQLLEWALRENLSGKVASEDAFEEGGDDVLKYSELIAMLGETLDKPGMTDGDDAEYQGFAKRMIEGATQAVQAVKLKNSTMAREAVGKIDQACNACHNGYR